MEYKWRTLVIDSECKLSCEDSTVSIKNDDGEKNVPICQLKSIIISSTAVSITIPLLNELVESDVDVLICDEKHNPYSQVVGLGDNTDTAGRIIDQCGWTQKAKADTWKFIVEQKIKNQIAILELFDKPVPDVLVQYRDSVLPDDESNREALAAKVYFDTLFGVSFTRHADDNINHILNYGYTIVQSAFTRILVMHGYSTALGIKHISRENRFNLSCDLMEPFRPMVDMIAFMHRGDELDWSIKKELIAITLGECKYNDRQMSVEDCIEQYVDNILDYMKSQDVELKRIDVV